MGIYEAYEDYYGSRLYDRRYPRANRRTVALVRRAAPAGSTLVDVGAGNGRYALPLARIGYRVVAVERSSAARAQMAERLADAQLAGRVEIHADLLDVEPATLEEASTALLLFGVLGHMDHGERSAVLGALSRGMRRDARLLGSVPNRFRRFRTEQREARIDDAGSAPRFAYQRTTEGGAVGLEYTAFAPAELKAELVESGWCCCELSPESILPEALVTAHPLLGVLDETVSRVVPPAGGYCIFYEAANHRRGTPPPALSAARRGRMR